MVRLSLVGFMVILGMSLASCAEGEGPGLESTTAVTETGWPGTPGWATEPGSATEGQRASESPDELRCSQDVDCPASAPHCSSSGYCLACLHEDHCNQGTSCTDGHCLPTACSPGAGLCAGGTLATCDADGAGWTTLPCPGSQGACQEGQCINCDAGSSFCTGKSQMARCLPDGSALVAETCGDDGFCVEGACRACYPGTTRSDGQWVQTCSATGAWEDTDNCGSAQGQCAGGVCQSTCGQGGKLTNEGCDYWAIDMDNEGPAADSPYAIIVSNLNNYEVAIEVTSRTSSTAQPVKVASGVVAPGHAEAFQLPQQNMGKSGIFWKALRVQSTGPIVAYQFNPLDNVDVFSNDASLLLPSHTYGTEYVAVSREEIPASGLETFRGSIAVVATEPSTTVTVTSSAPTMAGAGVPALSPGQAVSFTLEPYQVLNLQSDMLGGDLTGTIITSDKPIGVFGGHEAAVGSEQCCADHLEQQLFPVSTWGHTYIGTKSHARGVERDYWRVVAAQDGTQFTVTPSLPGVPAVVQLDRGDFYEFETVEDFLLEATAPVMVAQTLASSQEIVGPPACLDSSECAEGYTCSWVSPECMADTPYCSVDSDCPASHSCACGDLGFCTCEPVGDPALILAVPIEQYRKRYVFLTPTNYVHDYINIVAPQEASVSLDGVDLTPWQFQQVGTSGFKVARLAVPDGSHTVEASQPVGVIAYGYDDDVSYGYPAGLSLQAQP